MSSKKQAKSENSIRNSGTGRNKEVLGNTRTKTVEDLKHRAYCWTLNNYTEADVISLKNGGTIGTVEKMIFGKEVGDKEGTPHLQGFTRFVNPIGWMSFKRANPRMNFRVVKGEDYDNYKYCVKQGIEHMVGMEKEEAEHRRRLSGIMPQKFGGYACMEDQIQNSKLGMERRMDLEDEAKDHIESKRNVDDEEYNELELMYVSDEWMSDSE